MNAPPKSWTPVQHTDQIRDDDLAYAKHLQAEAHHGRWEGRERIVYIQYHDRRPFAAVSEYVSYSPAVGVIERLKCWAIDDGLIHLAGVASVRGRYFDPGQMAWPKEPPDCQVWAAAHCTLPDDAKLRAYGFERLLEPLGNPWEEEDAREENGTVYCSVCKGRMADYDLCSHLFWTENGHAGPGADEIDPGGVKEAFHALLGRTELAAPLKVALLARQFQLTVYDGMIEQHCSLRLCGVDFGHRLNELEPTCEMQMAASWLACIDFDVPVSIETTLMWLAEYEATDEG